jgi:hypothetical protein
MYRICFMSFKFIINKLKCIYPAVKVKVFDEFVMTTYQLEFIINN